MSTLRRKKTFILMNQLMKRRSKSLMRWMMKTSNLMSLSGRMLQALSTQNLKIKETFSLMSKLRTKKTSNLKNRMNLMNLRSSMMISLRTRQMNKPKKTLNNSHQTTRLSHFQKMLSPLIYRLKTNSTKMHKLKNEKFKIEAFNKVLIKFFIHLSFYYSFIFIAIYSTNLAV